MSGLVQVALAENVAEAEELQEILPAAGIDAELETAVEHHPRETEDAPQKVLVQESELEAAQQILNGRDMPAAAPAREHPAGVQLGGDGPQGGRAARPDVLHHRCEVLTMPIGVATDRCSER